LKTKTLTSAQVDAMLKRERRRRKPLTYDQVGDIVLNLIVVMGNRTKIATFPTADYAEMIIKLIDKARGCDPAAVRRLIRDECKKRHL
jgi:hypothetical protein